MKRMNYIRQSLEVHDPMQVTEKIRDYASRKKEEKILEIWKKDLLQPKIGELVAKMQNEKLRIPRNDYSVQNLEINGDELRLAIKAEQSPASVDQL